IHAVLLEERQKGNHEVEFPVLALVVSGGHTHLYLARTEGQSWHYENVGHTRDDAAGEAFDKVAKLLGLGYPGGPVINRLAEHGNPHAVKFTFAQMKHADRNRRREIGNQNSEVGNFFDFSFSGIKTAVLRYVETQHLREVVEHRQRELSKVPKPTTEQYLAVCDRQTLDLVASFQFAVVEDLVHRTMEAARIFEARTVFVTGGVAANSYLRTRFEQAAAEEGVPVYFPSRPLSTDNAAMIAAAAYPKFLVGDFADPELCAEAALRLK
ncbi:MAG: tRNA (adenosine(37)-N6)-threonylcarbamoyltransferase complex transferase subunit TsaD, partial [Terriglobales bacterium]